jgi:hypothetical protein
VAVFTSYLMKNNHMIQRVTQTQRSRLREGGGGEREMCMQLPKGCFHSRNEELYHKKATCLSWIKTEKILLKSQIL